MNLQKGILILLFMLMYTAYEAFAGDGDTLRLNPIVKARPAYYQPLVLKTSPTAFLWGGVFPFTSEYRFAIEINSSRTQSEQFSLSWLGKGLFLRAAAGAYGLDINVAGWRVQYAHKFYLIRKTKFAPYGFYVAPLVSYANAHISSGQKSYNHGTYLDFRHLNFNAIAGIQIGKLHRLTFDAYAGFGYRKNKVFYHYANGTIAPYDTKEFGELYNLPLNAVFGINLGYSL
jgi:hypothetical protein